MCVVNRGTPDGAAITCVIAERAEEIEVGDFGRRAGIVEDGGFVEKTAAVHGPTWVRPLSRRILESTERNTPRKLFLMMSEITETR